jgi:hypothetical protein
VKDLVRPFASEPARLSEEVIDLPIPLVSEPVIEKEQARFLPRALVSEPVRDSEPKSDLARPLASEATRPNELVNDLLIPLISDPVGKIDPFRDLENESFSATARDSPSDPEMVVEQERGLELQIIFPESTFATMLPIVNVIEAANVLMKMFFSTRLVTRPSEPGSVLKNEFFSEKVDTKPSVPDSAFPTPFVRELANVSELLRL